MEDIDKIIDGGEARFPWWIVLLFVVLAGWGLYYFIGNLWPKAEEVVREEAEEPQIRRLIDGVFVAEGTAEAFPLAVILENSRDAWPISGVAAANLVWEAPMEASIPRLLAIYADGRQIDEIGPVRSARPYFTDWAEEFGALYAHVGGSPEALSLIPSRNVIDLNEFWEGKHFWRSTSRPRPHNVYTSTELLYSSLPHSSGGGDKGGVVKYVSWQYKKDEPLEARPESQEVLIHFAPTTLYNITWKYDRQANEYVRWQNGDKYLDADGSEVRAKNVIIFETDIVILDEIGRRRITTIGQGSVKVFRDGIEIDGTWKRAGHNSRTRFFDDTGEIQFNPGTTWIEVVPRLSVITQRDS